MGRPARHDHPLAHHGRHPARHRDRNTTSLAPGGGYDEYTRSQQVDIDIYAAGHAQAMRVMAGVEARLAVLQGAGDEYGYVDESELSGFAELPHTPPDIIRLAGPVPLAMRPQ